MPILVEHQGAKPSGGDEIERVVLGPLGERIEHRVQIARLGRSAAIDPPEDLLDPPTNMQVGAARDPPPSLAERLQALARGVRTHLQIVLDLDGQHVLVLEHPVDGDEGRPLAQGPDEPGELASVCPCVCQTTDPRPDLAVRRREPTTPEDGCGGLGSHVTIYYSKTRTVVEDEVSLPPDARRPADISA